MRVLIAFDKFKDALSAGAASEELSLADYTAWFSTLPRSVQEQVTARWGAPECDPFYRPGRTDCGAFRISAFRCGNLAVGVQPARLADPAAGARPVSYAARGRTGSCATTTAAE